ncbi:MAG TPA: aminotransferase class V-fold PLP-dependent enzyme [Aggregatilineales bacterium]|nr:aminotransferase class V-fold PLP-dependent enzyme [Anaerolineales bacterium]HRE49664.1 aminotransferase class V-fold PLP-dependent enzyme [Aggregatilineales bacterium]
MRDLFHIDQTITFLNHGSFGACPRPVFEEYQRWQRELERQPVDFIGRRLNGLLDEARATLAGFINADVTRLTFVPNATAGVNLVVQSLDLHAGDEILTTDQEYGACDLTWEHFCKKHGALYIKQPLPVPPADVETWVDALFAGVTPRTKMIFLSHIAAPTATIFPVAEVCARARAMGIMTLIDGAHAPGHIPIDLTAIDPDFYAGNCHKWLCAPKGSAFLYAHSNHHAWLEPLVISWGYTPEATFPAKTQFTGTIDPAAYLTVPKAIEFHQGEAFTEGRDQCHRMVREIQERLSAFYNVPPLATGVWSAGLQMVSAPLPETIKAEDVRVIWARFWEEHKVEVPFWAWRGRVYIRVSYQVYNRPEQLTTLFQTLRAVAPPSGG